jgi:putative glutamine amidotransferase
MGAPILEVNSHHHQGLKVLGKDLRPVGFASDGLIEAIELPGNSFVIAVQWHPEWLTDQEPTRRLFGAFVEAAEQYGMTSAAK